jgi:hypothetical protein
MKQIIIKNAFESIEWKYWKIQKEQKNHTYNKKINQWKSSAK